MKLVAHLGAAALLGACLTGCGNDGDAGADTSTLTVFAAASLTTTFEELEQVFEEEHPDVDVRLSFAGSSDLLAQLVEGAEADVFASADTKNMETLIEAGLAEGGPLEFATNTLIIAVPPGNPAGIENLADLTEPDLQVVLCAPEVPCGNAAAQVIDGAGLEVSPVSEEQSVSDVLAKVAAGEADAGLVYRTDVAAAGDAVEGIAFEESASVVNHYPIASVEGAQDPATAQAWIDLVLGEAGQQVFADAGFGPPAP